MGQTIEATFTPTKHKHKRALVLTARKLVRLVDTLLRNRQLYVPPKEVQETE